MEVRLYRPLNGSKEYRGTLTGYDRGDVTIETPGGEAMRFAKKELALVRLYVDF